MNKSNPLKLVPPLQDGPSLPYRRGESASEIAYRIHNGIRRAPMFVSERGA